MAREPLHFQLGGDFGATGRLNLSRLGQIPACYVLAPRRAPDGVLPPPYARLRWVTRVYVERFRTQFLSLRHIYLILLIYFVVLVSTPALAPVGAELASF